MAKRATQRGETVNLTLRLPKALYESLRSVSEESLRSISAEAEYRIRQSLKPAALPSPKPGYQGILSNQLLTGEGLARMTAARAD